MSILRTEGARTLWFRALGELGYRRVALRECVLNEPFPRMAARLPLTVGLLEEAQVDEYNAFRQPADRNAAQRRLAAGDRCFVARHNGRIVGVCWTATGRAWSAYLSRLIPLAADEAYMYDAFTAPSLRGMGIYPTLASATHLHCQSLGLRRVICVTVPENRRALGVQTGYRTVGILGYIKIWKWRHEFCRMLPGVPAPRGKIGDRTGTGAWDKSLEALEARGHYLDGFLADLKRRAYLELIERWGGVPSDTRVLKTDLFEEAIGPDAFLTQLSKSGTVLIGMDISLYAATRAQQHDSAGDARYLVADARHLPFASASIGLVISPSTLDHFVDQFDLQRSLRELARVLAPGGRLIITLDNRQNVFDPLLRVVNSLGLVPYCLGPSYTREELRRELTAAGLEVRDTAAIVHHPRLTAVAAVAIARRVGSVGLTNLVHRTLLAAQRLQNTRWQYFSGCFVAALAVPVETDRDACPSAEAECTETCAD